jgi:hypothetical protein
MDKAFWGIGSSSSQRRNPDKLSNAAFLLQLGKPDPGTLLSMSVHPDHGLHLIHIPGTVIHMPGIFIHIPGIGIHILPEFLFTSLRNPYPHAPEYAAVGSPLFGMADGSWQMVF